MSGARRAVAGLTRALTVLRSGRWLELGQYRGNYRRMERIYLLDDPWSLEAPREAARFELINAVISRVAPICGSLLEVGSGEGAQTRWLLEAAPSVTGLEVSAAAVARARLAVPEAEFVHGAGEDARSLLAGRRFDMATACEVLYYARDPGRILAQLMDLAPILLVVNYERRATRLEPHLRGPGWTRLEDLESHGMRWRCHVWRSDRLAARS